MILNVDRRFAQEPSWVFFMYDLIEKLNIQSANRRVVSSRRQLRRQDVYQAGNFNTDVVSTVPHIIRSSFAYKRAHYLDLKTIITHLGPPQIFLTFSCNDFDPIYKTTCNNGKPWDDPVMFASYFKRRWTHFNSRIIKGRFATLVGGITNSSWVMETQDRGSPHMHRVSWIGY